MSLKLPSSTKRKRKEKKYSEKYNFSDGDLEIVSSDGVVYKVHSYTICAASSVFRTMLLPSGGPIKPDETQPSLKLVDTDMETSRTVGILLDIIYRSNPGSSSNKNGLRDLTKAYEMATKWDCQSAIQVIRLTLKNWIVEQREGGAKTSDFFRLAATMNDREMAALAIQYPGGTRWTNEKSDPAGSLYGAKIGNPTAWDWSFSSSVPRQYLWAYTKAWEEERVRSSCKMYYDRLSARFLVFLTAVAG